MKLSLSLLCLALFALATPALSRELVTQDKLDELETLLLKAPLEEEQDVFDDGEDDEESRIWNPLKWVKDKFRNKCKCENNVCNCCFKLKIFNNKACLKSTVLVEEKKLGVSFELDEKVLFDRKFNVDRDDTVCGNVPTPLNFLKYCFQQKSAVAADSSISSCSRIDFKVGNTIGAVLQFKCLELKNGQLTFGGYSEVEKEAMLVVKVKNPFKSAIAWFKKNKTAKVL